MDLKQFFYKNNRLHPLKGFIQVVRTGSVTTAAKQLNLTQPAISLQLQTLERDLGITLFRRIKRHLELTEDGKNLYELAVPLIQDIDSLYERFLETKRRKHSLTLNIAANHPSILYILPKLLATYKQLEPDTEITIHNIPRTEAVEKLINNELHLAIYPVQEVPTECNFIPIIDYDPILLIRKDHPLAAKENVTLEDVAHYNLVRIDPHLITLPLFEEMLKNFNIKSSIHFHFADWEILKQFVRAGLGVAIISNICLEENEPLLIGRALPRYFPPMPYGMLIKRNANRLPQVEKFLQIIER